MKEPRAVARRTDPGTSWEAARSVDHIRESQVEVLDCIARGGLMTDEELVDILASEGSMQSPSGIRTRRNELVDMGRIRDSGKRARGKTGRRMILWETVPLRDEQTSLWGR